MRTIRHEAKAGFAQSLWTATAPPGQSFPRLESDVCAEVAIIGGGYAGLSTAFYLATRNIEVVLLDAHEPGWGASGRNNGGIVPDLAFGTATGINKRLGIERGQRVCRLVDDSAQLLGKLIAALDDDCDLTLTGFLDAAHKPQRLPFLRKRFESLVARGLQAHWLGGEESAAMSGSPLYRYGGYLLEGAGHIHPLKLARALARAVARSGGKIFADSEVLSITPEGDRWRIRTPSGSVLARRVAITVNAYAGSLWPGLSSATIHMQPWLVATKPLPPDVASSIIPENYLLGDSHPGPYFFRKDAEGRLSAAVMRGIPVFGGVPDLSQMVAVVHKTFPQILHVEFEFVWQGLGTLQPGELPRLVNLAEGVWAAFGFGRGVTMANVIGNLLGELCAGGDPDSLALPVSKLEKIRFGGAIDSLLPAALRLANARG